MIRCWTLLHSNAIGIGPLLWNVSHSSPTVRPVGTFDELYANLDPNPQVRGFEAEEVCRWFLQNDPGYASLLRRVWLWKEWPGRWSDVDAGIDLVAEDFDGKLWAIQVKARAEQRRIPKRELDAFLSESGRPAFSYRLLITTTNAGLHPVAANTVAAQEKPVLHLDRDALQASPVDWPERLEDLRLSTGAQDQGESLPLTMTEEFVDARVPADCSFDGQNLGRWVIQKRQLWAQGKLPRDSAERLQRLPGWVFNCHEAAWCDNYNRLTQYVAAYGDSLVPVGFEYSGTNLGAWVVNQRTRYASGRLEPHRVRRLEALPGWAWDPFLDTWDEGLRHLQRCGREVAGGPVRLN